MDLTQAFKTQAKPKTQRERPATRASEFMQQAGRLRNSVNKMQLRISTATKDKSSSSLFAAGDYIDDLLVKTKTDLGALPTQIAELGDKGRRAGVDSRLLKALEALFNADLMEGYRDFGKLVEKQAQAAKTKEDRRNRLDFGPQDTGRRF